MSFTGQIDVDLALWPGKSLNSAKAVRHVQSFWMDLLAWNLPGHTLIVWIGLPLARIFISSLSKPRLGPFKQNFPTPLRHRQSKSQPPEANTALVAVVMTWTADKIRFDKIG